MPLVFSWHLVDALLRTFGAQAPLTLGVSRLQDRWTARHTTSPSQLTVFRFGAARVMALCIDPLKTCSGVIVERMTP